MNFPSLSTHFDVNEYADGRRWHEVGAVARVGDGEAEIDAHRRLAGPVAAGHTLGGDASSTT